MCWQMNTGQYEREGLLKLRRLFDINEYRRPEKCPNCGCRSTLRRKDKQCFECCIKEDKDAV